ncbi:class I SAM-dependent methyltransferase [Paucidesulfovibrio longus]|uniref:class I SAM-dependent methyltransferase n=1 Tax=Paucidesulfovibrio longus TaxID=889 RepID=UPI0003B7B655|nr:class I SAM-dependent methyltransferase [Paucidesulfovibrio longus]
MKNGAAPAEPMEPRAYWDKVAQEKSFTTPLPLDELRARLAPQARILDYGCGYGRAMRQLADAGFTNLLGMDFSERMLARGRALWPDLRFAACGPEGLPLPDAGTDAVLLLAVLTCIRRDADQDALLAELRRVLRPGGLLLVNDFLLAPDARNQERYARFEPRFGTFGVFEIPGGGVMRHYAPERLRALLGGFEILSWDEQTFTTMNGNSAHGVTVLAQRPQG